MCIGALLVKNSHHSNIANLDILGSNKGKESILTLVDQAYTSSLVGPHALWRLLFKVMERVCNVVLNESYLYRQER